MKPAGTFGAAALIATIGERWRAQWRAAGGLRLRRRSRSEGALVRLSSQALTPHASVHAVRWKGEELLIGCTAQHVTLLSRRPAAPVEGGAG